MNDNIPYDLDFDRVIPTLDQINKLYRLLLEREHTISHRQLPTIEKHRAFVVDHPYRAWYLISIDGESVGSVYLKYDNSIGVNLLQNEGDQRLIKRCLDFIVCSHKPAKPEASIVPDYFFINVPASNVRLISSLDQNGWEHFQISFRKI